MIIVVKEFVHVLSDFFLAILAVLVAEQADLAQVVDAVVVLVAHLL